MSVETQNTVVLTTNKFTQIWANSRGVVSCESGKWLMIISETQPAHNTHQDARGISMSAEPTKDVFVLSAPCTIWGKSLTNTETTRISPATY